MLLLLLLPLRLLGKSGRFAADVMTLLRNKLLLALLLCKQLPSAREPRSCCCMLHGSRPGALLAPHQSKPF
jgi:hypothetical protein